MSEDIKKEKYTIKELMRKYKEEPNININAFLNNKNKECLMLMRVTIEKKLYTEYEYDLIEMLIIEYGTKYDNEEKFLEEKIIAKKEYEEMINIFNKISSYYNL